MTAWHRPDVETAALEYLTRAVGDETGARQIVDGLLARGRKQGVAALVADAEQRAAAYGSSWPSALWQNVATLIRELAAAGGERS